MTHADDDFRRIRRNSRSPQREVLLNFQVPAELQSYFEKTPLLKMEDPKPYHAVLRRFAQDITPSDTIEWIWVKDVADRTWNTVRYRRIVVALIDLGQREAIAEIFAPDGSATNIYEKREARELAEKWFDAKTKIEVEAALKKYGLDTGSIMAVSFSKRAGMIELAERLAAASEIQRNNTLCEIEERRLRLGRALRQVSDQIIADEVPVISSRQEAAE